MALKMWDLVPGKAYTLRFSPARSEIIDRTVTERTGDKFRSYKMDSIATFYNPSARKEWHAYWDGYCWTINHGATIVTILR